MGFAVVVVLAFLATFGGSLALFAAMILIAEFWISISLIRARTTDFLRGARDAGLQLEQTGPWDVSPMGRVVTIPIGAGTTTWALTYRSPALWIHFLEVGGSSTHVWPQGGAARDHGQQFAREWLSRSLPPAASPA